MNKSKLGILTLITVLLLSYSVAVVAAQYNSITTNVAISNDGAFYATEPDFGISYQIQGTPMATGSVTANIYPGNPQPTASCPDGITLNHFVSVTFNMNANEFSSAKITLSYTDSDVTGLSQPFAIYKYVADTNSYVALPSTVDTTAKTITISVASIADPIFAIGGATASSGGIPTSTWAIIAVSVIVIVVLAVFAFTKLRTRVER
jgi:hypothetical protein